VLKLTTGRVREVKPVVWIIAAVFVLRFAYLGNG
jgi:AGZA family xanthine/uracil permease-like MFS transporter